MTKTSHNGSKISIHIRYIVNLPTYSKSSKILYKSSHQIQIPERHHDRLVYNTPLNTSLGQEIVDTIFGIRRLGLIVIIPAQSRRAGSPLALAFIFIKSFLTDWESHNIQWGLFVNAHPRQRQTLIQIYIDTYPSGCV